MMVGGEVLVATPSTLQPTHPRRQSQIRRYGWKTAGQNFPLTYLLLPPSSKVLSFVTQKNRFSLHEKKADDTYLVHFFSGAVYRY